MIQIIFTQPEPDKDKQYRRTTNHEVVYKLRRPEVKVK